MNKYNGDLNIMEMEYKIPMICFLFLENLHLRVRLHNIDIMIICRRFVVQSTAKSNNLENFPTNTTTEQ